MSATPRTAAAWAFAGNDGVRKHAAMGIASEGGELLSAIKAHDIYGIALDAIYKKGQTLRENIIEELGDSEFFMEALRSFLHITREETLSANMTKLAKRYPSYEYTDSKAQERADKSDDDWIEWHGGECPVAGNTIVDGYKSSNSAKAFLSAHNAGADWWRVPSPDDIIAYRIVQ